MSPHGFLTPQCLWVHFGHLRPRSPHQRSNPAKMYSLAKSLLTFSLLTFSPSSLIGLNIKAGTFFLPSEQALLRTLMLGDGPVGTACSTIPDCRPWTPGRWLSCQSWETLPLGESPLKIGAELTSFWIQMSKNSNWWKCQNKDSWTKPTSRPASPLTLIRVFSSLPDENVLY